MLVATPFTALVYVQAREHMGSSERSENHLVREQPRQRTALKTTFERSALLPRYVWRPHELEAFAHHR